MSQPLEVLRKKALFTRAITLLFPCWSRERSVTCCMCGAADVVTLYAYCDLSGYYAPSLTAGAGALQMRVSFCDDCLRDALKKSGRT